MSEPIKYRLPWPPSVNHYWGRRGNHVFISKAGKLFLRRVLAVCAGAIPLRGRLSVRLYLILPDRRERDVDNYLKSTFDALAKARVFVNDSQVDELYVKRGPVRPPGACEIEITELPPDGPVQISLLDGLLEAEAANETSANYSKS